LECLSVGSLAELADELQRCVHEYSEELVAELASRDELDFEKELKNQFIWLLLRVQKRRHQFAHRHHQQQQQQQQRDDSCQSNAGVNCNLGRSQNFVFFGGYLSFYSLQFRNGHGCFTTSMDSLTVDLLSFFHSNRRL